MSVADEIRAQSGQLTGHRGEVVVRRPIASRARATRISRLAREVGVENAAHAASTRAVTYPDSIPPGRRRSPCAPAAHRSRVDNRRQQSVAIAEVVLDHTPGNSGPLGDVLGVGGRETFLETHRPSRP